MKKKILNIKLWDRLLDEFKKENFFGKSFIDVSLLYIGGSFFVIFKELLLYC